MVHYCGIAVNSFVCDFDFRCLLSLFLLFLFFFFLCLPFFFFLFNLLCLDKRKKEKNEKRDGNFSMVCGESQRRRGHSSLFFSYSPHYLHSRRSHSGIFSIFSLSFIYPGQVFLSHPSSNFLPSFPVFLPPLFP